MVVRRPISKGFVNVKMICELSFTSFGSINPFRGLDVDLSYRSLSDPFIGFVKLDGQRSSV
jgi:hypothetical protein